MSEQHRHARPKSPQELPPPALETVLIEKGLVDRRGRRRGGRVRARDRPAERRPHGGAGVGRPGYRSRLLADAAGAVGPSSATAAPRGTTCAPSRTRPTCTT